MTEVVPFGVKGIDELLDGGFETGAPAGIFSMPNMGKSVFSMQMALSLAKTKGVKTLYYDTESFWMPRVLNRWMGHYATLLGISPEDCSKLLSDNVKVIMVRDLFDLAKTFGFEVVMTQSESRTNAIIKYPKTNHKFGDVPKETQQNEDWLNRSPIYEELKKNKARLVVIDSFSAPIKSKIPTATQNLGARQAVSDPFLEAMRSLSMDFDCIFFSTHHISSNPQGHEWGRPWGGADVSYWIKTMLGILPGYDKYFTEGEKLVYGATRTTDGEIIDQRRLMVRIRVPGLPVAVKKVLLGLNKGFIDLPSGTVGKG